MKGKIVTDKLRRMAVSKNEPLRMALRYIIRNESIPLKNRFKAQFKLSEMPYNTSKFILKPRCIVTGRGRGVVPEFQVSRIVFRNLAREKLLTGIETACW